MKQIISNHKIAIIVSFFVGIIFSTNAVLCLAKEKYSDQYKFKAVKYDHIIKSDNYHYYAHLNSYSKNEFIYTESDVIEKKGKITFVSVFYLFSYLLGSIGFIIFKKVSIIYCLNMFLWPLLNFLIIYWFCYTISSNIKFSTLTTLILVVFANNFEITVIKTFYDSLNFSILYPLEILRNLGEMSYLIAPFDNLTLGQNYVYNNNFSRVPNIGISNIVFVLFIIYLYKFKFQNFYLRNLLLLGISFGLVFYSYPILIFISFFIGLVFLFEDFKFHKHLLKPYIFATIIALPCIIFTLKEFITPSQFYLELSSLVLNLNYKKPAFPIITTSLSFLTIFIVMIIALKNFKVKSIKFSLNIITGIFLSYLFSYIFFDYHKSDRVIFRGGFAIIFVCVSHVIFILYQNSSVIFKNFSSKKIPKKLKTTTFYLLISIILFSSFTSEIIYFKQKNIYYNDNSKVLELYDWINNNVPDNSVFGSLEPEIILDIPIYTNSLNYVPVIGRSQTITKEREFRFIELSKFLNLNAFNLKNLLLDIKPHGQPSWDFKEDDHQILELCLFYTTKENISNQKIGEFLSIYENINISKKSLKFQCDYIILKNKSNLFKDLEINNLKEVFINENFSVYKI